MAHKEEKKSRVIKESAIVEEVSHFEYLGCNISFHRHKYNKFHEIYSRGY
jgi:hypothetical protein